MEEGRKGKAKNGKTIFLPRRKAKTFENKDFVICKREGRKKGSRRRETGERERQKTERQRLDGQRNLFAVPAFTRTP